MTTTDPIDSRRGTADVGSVTLAYETFGSASDPTLLLVMGLGSQMISWDERLCRLLADQGLHVVRFDNRDIGLSTHLHEAGAPNIIKVAMHLKRPPYLLADMADDAVGLLDAIGVEQAHVFGISMGGMIAQTMAIRHPGRVASLTSVASTTSTKRGKSTPAAQAALLQPPPKDADDAVRRTLDIFRAIGSPGYPLNEERLRARARAAYERDHDPDGVTRQVAAIIASPDRAPGLGEVAVPTLVVHGADDPLVQLDGGEATAEAVPGAELLVLPGMGHDLPEQVWPRIVSAVVALIRRTQG